MATFPTPSQIFSDYKTILKSIKPTLNTNDKNSDFVIRGQAYSGLVSGSYGDQEKVNNDSWINSARPEALILFGQDYDLLQLPATPAIGPQVSIPGTNGSPAPVGMTLVYLPTGVLYQTTSAGTVSGGTATVAIECLVSGQIGNIASPDTLQIVSPPPGIGTVATLLADVADGADAESIDSYRQRLLSRVQSPPAGGNQTDYPNFAFEADASIRSVFIRRFGRGLGTVDVYITTGTTDIDTAVTQGLSIVRIPSAPLIAEVQAFYNAHVPLTDCAGVFAPTEQDINATMNVALASGLTLSSVPADAVHNPLNLTVSQLIQREMGRALYKIPVGGRLIPGVSGGVVPASDLETGLDQWLSAVVDPATGLARGFIPVLADRECQPLNGSSYDLPITGNILPKPGTMTVVLGIP